MNTTPVTPASPASRRPALRVSKFLPDALAGLAAFVLIFALSCGDTTVSANSLASTTPRPDHQPGVLLVALAFGAVVSFNSAFVRHLIRTYSVPRRVAQRRNVKSGTTDQS
ncbi:MAG: hypothetical protein WC807_09655 [Hyphomicrobium sp.]|jgi:hypothetical protein